MSQNETWALEYAPEHNQVHVNSMSEIMSRPIDSEWMIISFHSSIDEALEAEHQSQFLKLAQENRNEFSKKPGFIKAANKRKLENYLRDEAKFLASNLKENPSPKKLEEIMGIQRARLAVVRDSP